MIPKVTVLMSVYNGEQYLRDSIDSILNQTFTDYEFLIIDDGSKDKSMIIIESYDDSRIRLAVNDTNLGQAVSLNRGLNLAKGKYIARMDQDDISLPRRLEKQVKFMEDNPEIGISGCWVRTFGTDLRLWKYLTKHEYLRWGCLINTSIFAHPSVIIRKRMIDKYNLKYNKMLSYGVSDYDLWLRAQELFKLGNLNQILLKYRVHNNSVSVIHNKLQVELRNKLNILKLQERLGRKLTFRETEFILGKNFRIISGWIFLLIDCYQKENTYSGRNFLIKLIIINTRIMFVDRLKIVLRRISF